jgi:DNA-binding CsgD family transcriptional regulator
VRALIEARRQDVVRRGEGFWLASVDWGSAVLYNGLGRYDDALAAAERAAEAPRGLGTPMWVLADLIEAAVRSGKPERAGGALARLNEIADANGTEWSLGLLARSRALLSADEAAEQLRAAHELLTELGMEAFVERARRELLATGETVRKRTVDTLDELTPQEGQIARLAADGRTNPEIGAQLFLSPRTVEWHLRKVFTKLAISSRRQLRTALPDVAVTTVPV